MVNLSELIQRQPEPYPWSEGEKIPWDNPGFSQRMLQEHLTDRHDAASRRVAIIDRHVDWIHDEVLQQQPSRILDLGCGPGLYMRRLAHLGHDCSGIDFGPASIEFAREQARAGNLSSQYHLGDIRQVAYGEGFDLVMLIFGELNVFHPDDAWLILRKSREALLPGGQLLLEVHTYDAVQRIGTAPANWRTSKRGLFSPKPHLLLEESFWNENQHAATTRYYVVDAETAEVDRYAASVQAYTDEEYRSRIVASGFDTPRCISSLDPEEEASDFLVYLATAV